MKRTIKTKPKNLQVHTHKSLYDKDFYKWANTQAKLLKLGDYKKMDMENLIEEIESLGISQKDKLESHLIILLMHMLKYDYQVDRRSKSWELSIRNSRNHANKTLKQNPSLKSKLSTLVKDAYEHARLNAAIETGLDLDIFPEKCEWTIKEILGE